MVADEIVQTTTEEMTVSSFGNDNNDDNNNNSPGKRSRSGTEEQQPLRSIKQQRIEYPQTTTTPKKTTTTTTSEKEDDEKLIVKIILEELSNTKEDVLIQAMAQLVDITYCRHNNKNNDNGNRRERNATCLYHTGGHLKIVEVLKAHLDCKDLVRKGIAVLANVTCDNAQLKTAVRMVQGIQTLLATMKQFSTDKDVVCSAIKALENIVWDNETNAKIFVTELDGILFVTTSMKLFVADRNVIRAACKLINALCSFESLRKPILDSNAVSALGLAMDEHKDKIHIQNDAREALLLLL